MRKVRPEIYRSLHVASLKKKRHFFQAFGTGISKAREAAQSQGTFYAVRHNSDYMSLDMECCIPLEPTWYTGFSRDIGVFGGNVSKKCEIRAQNVIGVTTSGIKKGKLPIGGRTPPNSPSNMETIILC